MIRLTTPRGEAATEIEDLEENVRSLYTACVLAKDYIERGRPDNAVAALDGAIKATRGRVKPR